MVGIEPCWATLNFFEQHPSAKQAFGMLRRPKEGTPAKEGRTLVVNRSRAEGTYGTILEALKAARPGDCVQVREANWDEVLRLESGGTLGQGVTVQGMAEGNQPVVWQAPVGIKAAPSLIHLTAVRGFRLRNFALRPTAPCPSSSRPRACRP